MQKRRRVAAFDIDGTVFRSSLLIELVERLIEKGVFPAEARERYAKEEERWLDRKGDYEAYIAKVVELFGAELKGKPYDEVSYIAGEVIEEKKNRVYRYTRDLIKRLQKDGYFILGISHSPKFIVDGFGYEHEFDKVYGTFYASGASGNFTGEIEDKELIFNKQAILARAVRKEALSLAGSVAVGDTESDIAMLEAVERPIAFNPNQALYDHAKKRNWEIVVERKDVIYEL
ncbi:MAG: HAD-IB family hydrolase [Patescibacteria group bacterium]|nr:HAD-IB family hydrolase [Patescibacteria group bacterium]MDE1945007.1 HAD-IB family hydrolase [Patescibacteria group bacterium]MDE2057487.1 HAD-IB family hydrolase [Patescibacteria group bacterium]